MADDQATDRPAHGSDEDEYVYWTGCAANYDQRIAAVVRATVKVLGAAGLRLRFLGAEEACSGDAARRLGEEGLFQQLALQNIETLQRHGARRIVTHCAHCFHVLRNEYPRFGGEFEVVHHAELIGRLVADGRIPLKDGASAAATLHDSCYVGRYNRIFDAPRAALRAVHGERLREMPRSRARSFCCGAGGANYWYDVPQTDPPGAQRVREALQTGAAVLAAECPFCIKMLEQGAQSADPEGRLVVKDIAEIVADALDGAEPAAADDGRAGPPAASPAPLTQADG
ncbi:MAG TPA: (Fe-S)-binding protein [Geminicoccaceae bacterium]|nr:(Fe-S)-binding protein [Geminicoccaceae bacterium]